jgi:ssDNA-binding Zn-finger/Zn-ribbon topoisomerase 1
MKEGDSQIPTCPKCGAPMVERRRYRDNAIFLGCSRFPECKGIRQADRHYGLHRMIWEKKYGPIPDGYDIHHRDGNEEFNPEDCSNFLLVTRRQHKHIHNLARRMHKKYGWSLLTTTEKWMEGHLTVMATGVIMINEEQMKKYDKNVFGSTKGGDKYKRIGTGNDKEKSKD